MRILVTNDDGVYSDGLWSLASALNEIGKVSVVAPDRDMSGIGTAMTLLSVLRTEKIQSPINGVDAIAVQGTPADCVILALESLFEHPFDLCVSGVNHGANLGLDIVSSGTVGAAMQSYLRGVPSIAVSVASLTEIVFDIASLTASVVSKRLLRKDYAETPLINVNLPNGTKQSIKGVCVTRLGPRAYLESVIEGHDGRRTHYWIKHDRMVGADAGKDTDIWAVRNGWISISSIDWGQVDRNQALWLNDIARLVADELNMDVASFETISG